MAYETAATIFPGERVASCALRMATVRKFALNLDRRDWPNEAGYSFYCQSRARCHFVERSIRTLKLPCVTSKLVVEGVKADVSLFTVNSSNVGCVRVPFDDSTFASITEDSAKHEFFIRFARRGLDLVPDLDPRTIAAIHAACDEFRTNGYANRWQHKRRSFRPQGFSASLDCELSLAAFRLFLTTTPTNGACSRRLPLTCDPDEIAFHYRFDDLVIEEASLVVTSKGSQPLSRISLHDLANS